MQPPDIVITTLRFFEVVYTGYPVRRPPAAITIPMPYIIRHTAYRITARAYRPAQAREAARKEPKEEV